MAAHVYFTVGITEQVRMWDEEGNKGEGRREETHTGKKQRRREEKAREREGQ